ncbi:transposase, IS605 OrfB family [Stanieria cyanosphaera PCC 7437]|uniref:Transposase, IS605 OrfB family n=1 Tax=Stanieria cyanosphaera (strain ATCC 29371 / PCC 7437) TaxID=111780 RepID=K9XZK9_STAC7|nr:IS200/IS605 family accessory protein TnpB-related protein [Stanieria cyanosphaera]AFZ37082.1 transposase, IS605 OrfB family [Stanieria cyanosphaera PCC 7437]
MVKHNIRTDKWQIVASEITESPAREPSSRARLAQEQKELLHKTVCEFRCLVRCLVGVIYTHWSAIGVLDAKAQIPAVEKLIHQTAKNPNSKYQYFNSRFHKFPSYYRRGAIQFAVGQVSSFVTRYRMWQSGIRNRKDTLPPRLNADCGAYPPLYKGQCIKFAEDLNTAAIKVYTGTDWVWITVGLMGHRQRHLDLANKRKSPYLIVNKKGSHLSVPFQCQKSKLPEGEITASPAREFISRARGTQSVLSVDLGINTTATVSVVNYDGTVSHREFIHHGRDIDRRDKRLKRISTKASRTGKLQKGFCRGLYRKANNINREIGQKISSRLVKIAKQFGVKYIVFEHLKGWRPKGGKKRSTLRQRFHGWLHRRIVNLTQMKWSEIGGSVSFVNPRGTSSYAYDDSGKLKRDKSNYAIAIFASGKQYNCDLSASYNIGARFIYRLMSRNGSQDKKGQNSCLSPRSRVTLSILWSQPISIVEQDTQSSRKQG